MKKLLALSFITFGWSFFTVCEAQITLSSLDGSATGDGYVEANDTTPTVTQGGAGPSQTWTLTGIADQKNDTVFYVYPASTPYSSDFPSTNLASEESYQGQHTYGYFNSGTGSLTTEGIVAWESMVFDMETVTPALKDFVYPAAYRSNWGGTYRGLEYSTFSGDSFKIVFNTAYYDTIDGWGMVTTPAGTYNSLRMVIISKPINDSEFEYNTNTHTWNLLSATAGGTATEIFNWFTNGTGDAVASVILDSVGGSNVVSASYLVGVLTNTSEITPLANANVYPNPASASITISLKSSSSDGYVNINDITGREIENESFRNGRVQLNTEGFADGMYLYTLNDMNGNLLDKGKFIVNH